MNKIHNVKSDDNQIPTWLNTPYKKITIETHSDTFEEQSYLPTFNTNAIESQTYDVPGLAAFTF